MGRDGFTPERASQQEKAIFGLVNFLGQARTGPHAAGHAGQADASKAQRRRKSRIQRASRRKNRR